MCTVMQLAYASRVPNCVWSLAAFAGWPVVRRAVRMMRITWQSTLLHAVLWCHVHPCCAQALASERELLVSLFGSEGMDDPQQQAAAERRQRRPPGSCHAPRPAAAAAGHAQHSRAAGPGLREHLPPAQGMP